MKCHTDCACNQDNECMRDTYHTNSARCKDKIMPKQHKKKRNDLTLHEVKK
jgi:hypothetical protein